MRTLDRLWVHSKFTAIMLVLTTIGWALLVAGLWVGMYFIGFTVGWLLALLGITALLVFLFWIIWDGFAKVVN